MENIIKVTFQLPRKNRYIHYKEDADRYLNLPITIDNRAIGVITKIINDTKDYIEVEGYLFNSGVNFFSDNNMYTPAEIEII